MIILGWHALTEVRATINTNFEIAKEIVLAEAVISHHLSTGKSIPVEFMYNLSNKCMLLIFINFQMLLFRHSVSTIY